ncbi:hypothetical protein G3545_08280 [Starkeya sp. ORNL1]|uniref:hypothetical protein n=1 Tax=Starkeya sp. ORNL1 TaxID=2709380 RepID=UPI00146310F6|nr:hypothetical protein [Starkeya sp. ORNL1]QJP13654.1 hypothetical protein G3545_08280 [Starkeya sp. ORNL1]
MKPYEIVTRRITVFNIDVTQVEGGCWVYGGHFWPKRTPGISARSRRKNSPMIEQNHLQGTLQWYRKLGDSCYCATLREGCAQAAADLH